MRASSTSLPVELLDEVLAGTGALDLAQPWPPGVGVVIGPDERSRLGVQQGYKQTEVGVIPEDWEVVVLGEFGTFKKGKGINKS